MANRLQGKRVVITNANDFMGQATQEVFAEEGAQLIADTSDLTKPDAAEALITDAGHVDVVIANLAAPTFSGIAAQDLSDADWECAFNVMVHPLHRLTDPGRQCLKTLGRPGWQSIHPHDRRR